MTGRLVHSKFTHAAQDPGSGTWILKNFFTGCLIELSPNQYLLYRMAGGLPRDSKVSIALQRGGFLVEEGEVERLRALLKKDASESAVLRLTIAPTSACNFCCPYCFETSRPGRMNEQVQQDVLDFARMQMESAPTESVHVAWYGGEPLLQPDIVERMSLELSALAESHGTPIDFFMYTNASLLDEELALRMKACGVNAYQITLDGPDPRTNDCLRRAKDGRGSFERIVGNLLTLPGGATVKLRHCVNASNVGLLGQMAALASRLDSVSKASIRLCPANMDFDVASQKLPQEEAASRGDLVAAFERHGFKGVDPTGRTLPGKYKGAYCPSQTLRSFVIDDKGLLYRCIEDYGVERLSFGSVSDWVREGKPDAALASLMTRNYDMAFPEEEECLACCLLPVCMGGCLHRYLLTGKRRCSYAKEDLDSYVLGLAGRCGCQVVL